eukprot:331426_1
MNNQLIMLSCLAASTFIMSIFFISILYKMYCQSRTKLNTKIIVFYRFTYLFCIAVSILCSGIDTFHALLAFRANISMLNGPYGTIKFIADLMFYAASNSLNIILFGRVYFTFKESIFKLSKPFIIFFSILESIAILCCFADCSLFIIFSGQQSIQDHYAKYVIVAIMFIHFVLSIFLLYLFNSKLSQLIVNTATLDVKNSTPILKTSDSNKCEYSLEPAQCSSEPAQCSLTPQRHYHLMNSNDKKGILSNSDQSMKIIEKLQNGYSLSPQPVQNKNIIITDSLIFGRK